MLLLLARKILQFLLTIFILAYSSHSLAIDSYENGILSIPKVVVGENVYSNVKISIKEILSIKGGKPVAHFDIFDSESNKLIIPEVTYAGKSYFNVAVTPDQIINVEKGWRRVGYKQKIEFGNFDLKTDTGLFLNNAENDEVQFDILAIGDVNMDGYDDVLISVMRVTSKGASVNRTVKPILLTFNPSINKFEVNQEFANVTSEHIWARQGAIVDLDGDGRNDIFIGDPGVDGGAYDCGYKNSLILNKVTGMTNVSNRLPNVNDYSHGLIVGDFNLDKLNDLMVINSPWISSSNCHVTGQVYRNRSYLLAGGSFNELPIQFSNNDSIALGYSEDNPSDQLMVGAALDFNKDGYLDFVLGGNYGVYIQESIEKLKFKPTIKILPPTDYFNKFDISKCLKLNNFNNTACFTPYSFVIPYDLDGDGQPEIIASLSNQSSNGPWRGQYFQVIKKINDVWVDVSNNIFPQQNQDQTIRAAWCYRIQFIDMNNDGQADILCSGYKSTVWINQEGKFFDQTSSYIGAEKQRSVVVKFPDGNYLLRFEDWYQGSQDKFNITGTVVN
jgi:hypothetical protein